MTGNARQVRPKSPALGHWLLLGVKSRTGDQVNGSGSRLAGALLAA
jgi:hypothetical protein